MMSVRPLHYWPAYIDNRNTVQYGTGDYLTHDGHFFIQRTHNNEWCIWNWTSADHATMNAVGDAGIIGVPFKRRIDAVHALEAVMAAIPS